MNGMAICRSWQVHYDFQILNTLLLSSRLGTAIEPMSVDQALPLFEISLSILFYATLFSPQAQNRR